ncbi:MAG: aspartate kinase [Parachlamydiaceae bacterium]|nr:aspartate kinase [Parachlamydiaceae bacterium]
MNTLVMKFGGAAFATPSHFSKIANLIIAKKKKHPRLIIVVSAMGKTTDQLIELAKSVNEDPPQREFDMLMSAGERISMSLLAMALHRENHSAISFTGSQSGIITCTKHSDAQILDVRPYRVKESLDAGHIVIIAGFQGVNERKDVTTLGRGGSDTTAVAIGLALNANKVEFYKDVCGIFDKDPKFHADAQNFSHLSYESALKIVNDGAKVLHPRAIQLAAKNGLPLLVTSFMSNSQEGTLIYNPEKNRELTPLYETH